MLNKSCEASFKALDGEAAAGTFSAVVAVFGNVDKQGDRILEGAFDRTLKSWQDSGDPLPIVLAHQWKDPFSHIGWADPFKVKSVPGVGLVVEEGHLDIDDNPLAKQAYKLMQRRTLKEFSFGYGIPKGGQEKARDGAFNLKALDLIEFGPCLKGVNDRTELLNIKSMLEGEPTFEDRLAKLEATISTFIAGKSEEDPVEDDQNGDATGEGMQETEDEEAVEEVEDIETPESEDTKSIDIDKELARLTGENALHSLEQSVGDLGNGKADDYLRRIDAYEADL